MPVESPEEEASVLLIQLLLADRAACARPEHAQHFLTMRNDFLSQLCALVAKHSEIEINFFAIFKSILTSDPLISQPVVFDER
jgi:hypothetical protein